jgi:CRISPR/Cas system-associated endoribonuclease Cas2
MERDELIRKIDEGIQREEETIPIYSKHIQSSLFLGGFEKSKRDKVAKGLDELRKGSESHKAILLGLKDKIRKGDKDVY